MKAKSKCYMLHEKINYVLKAKYACLEEKTSQRCALHVAPIVVLSACRFYMKFFQVFPWRLFYMQIKLVLALENKEQLIHFRVCGKSTTSAQTEGDG